jgi:L-fuculose-phosphate aldolase
MTPEWDDPSRRRALVACVKRLDATGLNRGSTGNASIADAAGRGLWITPTGMGAEVEPDDLAWVGWDGQARGRWAPSSEWQFHVSALRARPGRQAVLHTHSAGATALACLRRALPAFHYMVAINGRDHVPLVDYALFGSKALSAGVASALADGDACLLANHGLIATGPSLARAEKVLVEIESLCGIFLQALAAGEPCLLSAAEMAEVLQRFKSYGQARQA